MRPGTPAPTRSCVLTLFAFHGHGAHGQDLLGLAPYLAGGRIQVICPEAEFVLQPGALSYTWFERGPGGNVTPRSLSVSPGS